MQRQKSPIIFENHRVTSLGRFAKLLVPKMTLDAPTLPEGDSQRAPRMSAKKKVSGRENALQ
jgi:hypothetical protein